MWRTSALEQRTFREHERSLRSPFQGAADYKLRVTEAVGSGGIDPVDPVLERMVDRSDRLLVVLGAPAMLPVTAAECSRAEPDASDLKAGAAELAAGILRPIAASEVGLALTLS
jgi:hypothetical protein